MKIAYISLGCPKNEIDLEKILGHLGQDVTITNSLAEADATIVNTCAFIEIAKQESIDTVFDLLQLKEQNPDHKILVTGCLIQRYKDDLVRQIPEIDAFFDSVDAYVTTQNIKEYLRLNTSPTAPRKRITPDHYAYLKIAEGCDNRCSYCAIPLIKGSYRSRPFAEIIEEATWLVDNGVRELIVVAQDTTHYGHDVGSGKDIVHLLQALNDIPELQWLRLMYTHPAHWTDQLVEAIASLDRVVPYIEMPIQHISDRILRQMGRLVTRSQVETLIEKFRDRIPNLALRTSLIVGFPGETEKEFRELCAFVEQIEFERLGVFTYSREEGTRAFKLQDDVPARLKAQRRDEIMEIQADIAARKNAQWVGRTIDVIVDSIDEKTSLALGRSTWDAPEIDNSVFLSPAPSVGEIVKVKITRADVYDLYGQVIQ